MKQYPQHEDVRMKKIKHKIGFVRKNMERMHRYLHRVKAPDKKEAREALRRAFEAGCAYSELKQMPIEPPFVELDGKIVLGKRLREHILATREVYAEISQLRELTGNLLDERAEYLLIPHSQRQEERESGTSTTHITT
ncbi:MAG: hypothetical protein K9M03_02050 [Kiritimatiellales bacterium]|nr:hypothetical protein [Kiritimatiellales bacterium]